MREQHQKPSQPSAASMEADLFGTLFGFHQKAMTLVRQASLDDEKLKVVAERIKTLLDNVTTEMKMTQQINLKERLEAAYGDLKRLVDELSGYAGDHE